MKLERVTENKSVFFHKNRTKVQITWLLVNRVVNWSTVRVYENDSATYCTPVYDWFQANPPPVGKFDNHVFNRPGFTGNVKNFRAAWKRARAKYTQ